MKKLIFIPIASIFILSLNSCQKDPADFQDKHPVGQTYDYQGGEIYATHIDNGVDCDRCVNNILVFPDWETFRTTVESLETIRDQNITVFVENSDPTMTDLEFEAYADSLNFHEEQPYLDFEAIYQFASLRKKIYDERTAWLESLSEFEEWNTDLDPDSHFTFYEERVLLNEQAEVIVKDSLGQDVIYKFYEGGWVEIINNNYTVFQELNTTPDPVTHSDLTYHFPDLTQPDVPILIAFDPWNHFPGPNNPDPPSPDPCTIDNDIRLAFNTGGGTKIETMDKFQYYASSLGNPKVKSKTEYFRWHNAFWPLTGGAWTRGKTTLTAGITQEEKFDCSGSPKFFDEFKTEKRHKVYVKWTWIGPQNPPGPKVMDEMLFGTHKRRQDVTKVIDFYDGDVN